MSVLATNITRIAPNRNRACKRCGAGVNDRHPDTIHCGDCVEVLKLEDLFTRVGLDILDISDDRLERWSEMQRKERARSIRRYARRVHAGVETAAA